MIKCEQCKQDWKNGLLVESPDYGPVLYFCSWRCLNNYSYCEVYKPEFYAKEEKKNA